MEGRARIRIAADLGELELLEAVYPRPHFPRHSHPTYAVGVVASGANRFSYRGAFHVAPAGTVCTVTPEEAHAVEPAGGAGFAYRCLYPRAEAVREAAEGLGQRRVARTLALPPVIDDPGLARLVRAVFAAEEAGAPRLEREARLLAVLARLVARHALEPVVPRAGAPAAAAIAAARDYLSAHHAENVSLARLAAEVGLERFALLRGFARAYALPPHAWLLQERVRRAQALLRDGLPPAEVAAQVGFADQSHLNRHFGRLVGVTPGRYRAASGRATAPRAGRTAPAARRWASPSAPWRA